MDTHTNTPYLRSLVQLSDIEPSGLNPRKHFGDIDKLADAIRATGGEPINPIVCVKDGNRYRIVDGERRFRALREIYKDTPHHQVSVLCFESYTDAAEIRAMLATDSKEQLTDDERNAGFQTALKLDVDTQDISRMSGVAPFKVMRAKALVQNHDVENPALSLETLAEIQKEQLTGDEFAEVIGAERPAEKLEGIRARRAWAERREQMVEAIEGRGVRWEAEGDNDLDDYYYARYCGSADSMAEALDEYGASDKILAIVYDDGHGVLYKRKGAKPAEDPQTSETRKTLDEAKQSMKELCGAVMDYLGDRHARGFTSVPNQIADVVVKGRPEIGEAWYQVDVRLAHAAKKEQVTNLVMREYPSARECVIALSDETRRPIGYLRTDDHGTAYVDFYAENVHFGTQIAEAAEELHIPLPDLASRFSELVEDLGWEDWEEDE